jgi:hypothetical protein
MEQMGGALGVDVVGAGTGAEETKVDEVANVLDLGPVLARGTHMIEPGGGGRIGDALMRGTQMIDEGGVRSAADKGGVGRVR